jgi:alpha-glucosidase (family GH31 glycosyl hydrolase)
VKAPGAKRLKLEYDELLSNDAFNFKLRRYNTDGKRYMTWDSTVFPTPQRMIDDVASRGRKMVTIVDPHVKKAGAYTRTLISSTSAVSDTKTPYTLPHVPNQPPNTP